MKNEELKIQIKSATKWSTITEVFVKLIAPITSMILARLLTPNEFGIIATVSMVTSFADMFIDAGFQKYLVQHEFKNKLETNRNANVAFWTNLVISLIIWIIIAVFRNSIAFIVGNPGLGYVLAIACIQLPITAFSSIQLSLYRRNFNFRTLFIARIIGAFIPLIITIPLAYLGASYWALIIGNISGALSNAIILTIKSKWKPTLYYSFDILREMLSFSIWSLMEQISIWMTLWIDTFIIGTALNGYYLGLYKNSLSLVNALMAIVISSITPVLFSALSRLQDDSKEFNIVFLNVQKFVAYFIFPIGAGVYIYRDLATQIMLGSDWKEASNIIGIWALTSSVRIVLVSIYSEVYRAKGKPKLSLMLQLLDLFILIPVCIISLKNGFWVMVYARALIRLDLIIPGLIVLKKLVGIDTLSILNNIMKPILCTIIMSFFAFYLESIAGNNLFLSLISVLLCIIFYLFMLLIFAKEDIIKMRYNLKK